MGIAVSTSWNAFRHTDARALISEIQQIGFTDIELSFNLPRDIVTGITALVQSNQIRVVSLHNFCPIPDGVNRALALPDYYSMASLDEGERKRAVQQTKTTIDTASRLNAQAVVLHTGRVDIPDRTRDLIELFDRGKKDSPEFGDLRERLIAERRENQAQFFDNTLRSLDELNRYAETAGIQLGVETRFYYREIPNLEELKIILEKFRGSRLGYWHDVGHAQLMENLGIAAHRDFLELSKGSLLGVHLHNIKGCADHQAPIRGEFDFARLIPYLDTKTIKVIEAHHPATAPEIRESKKMLEVLFDGKI